MITIDAPISFLVGAGLALAAQDKENSTIYDRDNTLLKGLAMQAIILTPVIMFFMVRFPDWEWNYMFNAKTFFFSDNNGIGAAILALIMAAITLSFIVGFVLTEKMIKKQSTTGVYIIFGAAAALIVGLMAFMYQQTSYVGNLAEYQSGNATLLLVHKEFIAAQVTAGALLIPSFIWIVTSAKAKASGNL